MNDVRLMLVVLLLLLARPAAAGYSHYWEWRSFPDEARLTRCVDEMRRVCAARPKLAVEAARPATEGDGARRGGPPAIDFNGLPGETEHEPFLFPGRPGWNFCKTLGKPYDAVVVACLLVARDHFAADVLAISSDGAWEEGAWAAGAALYTEVTHRPAADPTTTTTTTTTRPSGRPSAGDRSARRLPSPPVEVPEDGLPFMDEADDVGPGWTAVARRSSIAPLGRSTSADAAATLSTGAALLISAGAFALVGVACYLLGDR
jgi:hypothetical protein